MLPPRGLGIFQSDGLPALSSHRSRFSDNLVPVLRIGNSSDGSVSTLVHFAYFRRRHAKVRVSSFVSKHGGGASRASRHLAPSSGFQLNCVYLGSDGNVG